MPGEYRDPETQSLRLKTSVRGFIAVVVLRSLHMSAEEDKKRTILTLDIHIMVTSRYTTVPADNFCCRLCLCVLSVACEGSECDLAHRFSPAQIPSIALHFTVQEHGEVQTRGLDQANLRATQCLVPAAVA